MNVTEKIRQRRRRERREKLRLAARSVMLLLSLLPAAILARKLDLYGRLLPNPPAAAKLTRLPHSSRDLTRPEASEAAGPEAKPQSTASRVDEFSSTAKDHGRYSGRLNTQEAAPAARFASLGTDRDRARDISVESEPRVADIPVRLDKKRYFHPTDVFRSQRPAARVLRVSPARTIELEPSDGRFDERQSVRIAFDVAASVSLLISIQSRRGGDTAGHYVTVHPVAEGPDGKDQPFTLAAIDEELQAARAGGRRAEAALSTAIQEQASRQAWLKTPGPKLLAARGAAKRRLGELKGIIAQHRDVVAYFEQRMKMLQKLERFAEELHDSACIQIELLTEP